MRRGPVPIFLFAVVLLVSTRAGAKAPFTFDAMMKLAGIGDPQLSPDGSTVAFTVQTIDMKGNTKPTQIYTVPLSGGAARQITQEGQQNTRPRWTPDSKRVVFTSDQHNGSQIWSMNADGGNPTQLTDIPTEAADELVSPDGKSLLFSSAVYPACSAAGAKAGVAFDTACNRKELDEEAAGKMHARVYTHLLYRHWTAYEGSRRHHLLIQSLAGGQPRDLTPGSRNVPPFSLEGRRDTLFAGRSRDRICYKHRSRSRDKHQLRSVHN